MKQAWINKREKAIRKENPAITVEEACRQAIGEYFTIFSDDSKKTQSVVPSRLGQTDELNVDDLDEELRDAIRESEALEREEGAKKGLSAQVIEHRCAEAMARVLSVAEQQGKFKMPAQHLFLRKIKHEEAEEKRMNAFQVQTGDAADVQMLRNEAARREAEAERLKKAEAVAGARKA